MKQGWEIKKLGEVCEVLNGYAFDSNLFTDDNTCAPIIRIRDIKRGYTETFYKGEYSQEYIINKGDYLIGMDGEFNIAEWQGKDSLLNQRVCKLSVASPELLERFVLWFMPNALKKIEDETPFVTVKHLSSKKLLNIPIPVPPLPVQEQIVSELDLLSGIIEKKREQLKELDALAQSIFYDMFGDPITNEKGWEVKKLGEVCDKIGDGLHGTPTYDENGEIAFINGNNLIDGKILITDRTLFVNELEAQRYRIDMNTNTILLSINGTLGRTAIYRNENIILGKSACYCNINDKFLTTKYVEYLMNSLQFKMFLEDNSSKSTIKNVGLKIIRNYEIILPPLPLQHQFATKIEAIEKQKELIKQSISETETLFNARMQHYFG